MWGVDPVADPDPFPDRPGWVSEGLKGRPDLALTPDTAPGFTNSGLWSN